MPKKKKEEEQRENEEEIEEDESVWDIKRIAIGLVVIGIFGFLGVSIIPKLIDKPQILGAFTKNTSNINKIENQKQLEQSQKEIQDILESAKENLSKLTPDNINSQAQQVQKIISDLKALQNHSKQPLDLICEQVCKGK